MHVNTILLLLFDVDIRLLTSYDIYESRLGPKFTSMVSCAQIVKILQAFWTSFTFNFENLKGTIYAA